MQSARQSLHSNLSLFHISARPHLSRRQRLPIRARQRSTRRATDQEPPPRDPFSRRRVGAGVPPPPPRPPPRNKEPFDAELLILFGLPTLIILIPWAVKDPAALALIPLAFLVPGVRDVLLAVLRSATSGVRKARVFMREDSRGARGTWAPPPRPPPPPPPGAPAAWGVYDLSEEDFEVRDSREEQWREYEDEERSRESSWSDEEEEESPMAAPPSTAAVEIDDREDEEEEEDGTLRRQRPRVPPSRMPGRVPPPLEEGDVGTAAVRLRRRPQPQPQPEGPIYDTDDCEEDVEVELTALERRKRRREARVARRRSLATVGAAGPASAPPAPRRRRRRNVPWYARPLLIIFPFLRDWGGFM